MLERAQNVSCGVLQRSTFVKYFYDTLNILFMNTYKINLPNAEVEIALLIRCQFALPPPRFLPLILPKIYHKLTLYKFRLVSPFLG